MATLENSLSLDSIVVATSEQVCCELGDEAAILNMKNSVYYGLNPLGTRIWTLLAEPRSVVQLRDAIVNEYDVEPNVCERDLFALLEEMRTEGLIEVRTAGLSV